MCSLCVFTALVRPASQAVCTPDPNCVCDSLIHCSLVQYTFPPSFSHFHSSTEALHDTDYFVTVSVTNHALLTSSLTHHITVDTTPPLPGAVFDAPLGVGDVDYQQGNTLQAWWSGYFDRETGVAFYQYAYGTQCVNMSLFSFPLEPESLVVQTMEEYASWLAPGDGTYYVTVVAYNNALQPSEPVCSDGITVDNVSPVFEGIRIPGSVVEPGLVVSWSLGEVWLVEGDRQRVYVGRATENEVCVNRSTPVDDLSQYPIRMRGWVDGCTSFLSGSSLSSLPLLPHLPLVCFCLTPFSASLHIYINPLYVLYCPE